MTQTKVPEEDFGVGFYSSRMAAKVARIRYQNFQAWAKANLLHGSKIRIGSRTETVYTYRDLLLIRLIVRLKEKGLATKKIKKALNTITDMAEGDPTAWLKAAIYVDSGLIVAMIPRREDWNPVAVSEGAQRMALIFSPALARELEDELIPSRFRHVEINPEILGGAPVIKGTRVPTKAVAALKGAGQDPSEAYPELSEEQVADATAYEAFLDAA